MGVRKLNKVIVEQISTEKYCESTINSINHVLDEFQGDIINVSIEDIEHREHGLEYIQKLRIERTY